MRAVQRFYSTLRRWEKFFNLREIRARLTALPVEIRLGTAVGLLIVGVLIAFGFKGFLTLVMFVWALVLLVSVIETLLNNWAA